MRASTDRKIEKIVRRALKLLGLEFEYLKKKASLPHQAIQSLKVETLTASQWIRICDVLFLPTDSLQSGYKRETHRAKIGFYWKKGLLDLPRTEKLDFFLREIKEIESSSPGKD